MVQYITLCNAVQCTVEVFAHHARTDASKEFREPGEKTDVFLINKSDYQVINESNEELLIMDLIN